MDEKETFPPPEDLLPEDLELGGPDQPAIPYKKVRDLLKHLANTVSSMKIFPSSHTTIKSAVKDFSTKLLTFLDEFGSLEVQPDETTFSYMGKVVYEEERSVRSFPFFFAKDGVQRLFLYRGLDQRELWEFLEIVKRESLLPPDESDIVSALWERDFPNIQYYAPDDFLVTKIVEKKKKVPAGLSRSEESQTPLDDAYPASAISQLNIPMEKSQLKSGRIVLTPEDLEFLKDSESMLGLVDETESSARADGHDYLPEPVHLEEDDMRSLEILIQSNRDLPRLPEFVNLLIEILYLEDEEERFRMSARYLDQLLLDCIRNENFALATSLLRQVKDLRNMLALEKDAKTRILSHFLDNIAKPDIINSLGQNLKQMTADRLKALFPFLSLLDSAGLLLLAETYENTTYPECRKTIINFLEDVGKKDIEAIMGLVHDGRPALTREIVRIAGKLGNRRALPYLADFLKSRNIPLRTEALDALARIKDNVTFRILYQFLFDPEESIRISAAQKYDAGKDRDKLSRLLNLMSDRNFRKRSPAEKMAFLGMVGRSETREASDFLQKLLKKPPFLPSRRQTETRLCAANALEALATPLAVSILKTGRKTRTQSVRRACRAALERLSASGSHEG